MENCKIIVEEPNGTRTEGTKGIVALFGEEGTFECTFRGLTYAETLMALNEMIYAVLALKRGKLEQDEKAPIIE